MEVVVLLMHLVPLAVAVGWAAPPRWPGWQRAVLVAGAFGGCGFCLALIAEHLVVALAGGWLPGAAAERLSMRVVAAPLEETIRWVAVVGALWLGPSDGGSGECRPGRVQGRSPASGEGVAASDDHGRIDGFVCGGEPSAEARAVSEPTARGAGPAHDRQSGRCLGTLVGGAFGCTESLARWLAGEAVGGLAWRAVVTTPLHALLGGIIGARANAATAGSRVSPLRTWVLVVALHVAHNLTLNLPAPAGNFVAIGVVWVALAAWLLTVGRLRPHPRQRPAA